MSRVLTPKKYPLHAAVELQDVESVRQLLDNECDASFHLSRRLAESEVVGREVSLLSVKVTTSCSRSQFSTRPAVPDCHPAPAARPSCPAAWRRGPRWTWWTPRARLLSSTPSPTVRPASYCLSSWRKVRGGLDMDMGSREPYLSTKGLSFPISGGVEPQKIIFSHDPPP